MESPSRGAGGKPEPWTEVILEAPAAAEEELAQALCDAGALGVQVDPAGEPDPGRRILHVYFEAGSPAPTEGDLSRLIPGLGPLTMISVAPVPDGRWVERWIASLAPFDVGHRFRIVPVTEAGQEPQAAPAHVAGGRLEIRILPGRAFGTGEHATTRLCLEALERLEPRGRSVLDVGTGSGILAIAACRLGAGRTVALDIDHGAVRAARANARLNPEAERILFFCGGVEAIRSRFDTVVANLNLGVIEQRMEDLISAMEPGGHLVLSGLLEEEAVGISGLASRSGAPPVRTATLAGWACAVHRRSGA